MKVTAWDLTLQIIQLMSQYDSKIEEKTKEKIAERWLMLDSDVKRIESEIFSIKNKLKDTELF